MTLPSSLARPLTTASAPDREGTDFYPTPPEATHALLDFLRLPEGTTVWECAAGEGHLLDVLNERGLLAQGSDLHNRTGRFWVEDFLQSSISRSEWIITNPPFSQAEAFIRHARALGVPFAFLLKGQFWHAQKRRALFEEHRPAYVLPLTWRPDFLMGRKGGSPTMEAAWTVWQAQPAESTRYVPLPRPQVPA